jgi:hypothetical protein
MGTGGALGISHGVASQRKLRPAAILHDGLTGAIAGPWTPILVPLALSGMWPHGRCPYYFRNRK